VSGCHINIGKILARMKRDKDESRQFFIISLDVKKAFDSVDRNKLLRFLRKTLTQETKDKGVMNILKQMLKGTRMHAADGSNFEYNMGVPQGGVLSPALFALYMHCALRTQLTEAQLEENVIAFADDLLIYANTQK
jgi:RNA-directed DNA polymerase